MRGYKLIVLVGVFLMVFGNISFITNAVDVYPLNIASNFPFLFSLLVVLACVNIILLLLLCNRWTIKPVLIILLLVSSAAGYFMDVYNIVIDTDMIDNVVRTDRQEAIDLIGIKFFIYIFLLGIIPSVYIYKITINYENFGKELITNAALMLLCMVISILAITIFSKNYASYFREHKSLRYYANPAYYLYSIGKYSNELFSHGSEKLVRIGENAKTPVTDVHRDLVIMVVGEAARADRFELNGYKRETNPYLKKQDVISYTNFWSCGTSTAVSVPCMFSILDAKHYKKSKSSATENALDIMRHAGVSIIWLDNNSSSKGVADRVLYKSYKNSERNSICDIECRDEGMLVNLQAYIDAHPYGDIFIVLHQMGNHGPAYYKRYPASFEKFTPTCNTNQLEKCTKEQINNAYDNAILYTDYFLGKVITLLKENSEQFEASMLYVSDHGESLGEKGIYLHGLPKILAPEEQIHVPLIMWFSDSFGLKEEVGMEQLKNNKNKRYSHDNLFHTMLGMVELETDVYDKKMDLIKRLNDS